MYIGEGILTLHLTNGIAPVCGWLLEQIDAQCA
jgi:hypothetical protein